MTLSPETLKRLDEKVGETRAIGVLVERADLTALLKAYRAATNPDTGGHHGPEHH